MKETIVCTHVGKMGDMLLSIPVADWIYRNRGMRVHWVLPRCFGPFLSISNLLLAQEHCAAVTLVDFPVQNWECGGYPYKFNPEDYGVPCPNGYFNFGFRSYPVEFLPAFFAKEYDLGYTKGYRLNLGEPLPKTDEILRSTEGALEEYVPHATKMPQDVDLLGLALRMQAAKEVHTWFCGLGILAAMSNIPVTIHRVPGHAYIPLYYEENMDYVTFIEHQPNVEDVKFSINDGTGILEAMGIDTSRVVKATVYFSAALPVIIDTQTLPEIRDKEKLAYEVKRYKLVPIEEDEAQ